MAKEDINFIIFLNEEQILYSSNEVEDEEFYINLVLSEDAFTKKVNTKEGREPVIAVKRTSDSYNVSVLVMESMAVIKEESEYQIPITVLIVSVFFSISMVFVMLLTRYLTKPIRQLREIMEQTRLENIGSEMKMETSNDEIEALRISYQNVLGRLQQAVIKEKRMSLLQLQAQFASLQSQVNPHFLYNVLNVISARGMESGDEKICEMCGSLATMLRYSTNTKARYGTIEEKMEYLEQYFYLLKARYGHKLVYEICMEEEINKQIIPRVALVQVVENCVNHGFENSMDIMKVVITGVKVGDRWRLKIHDNSEGFSQEALKNLVGEFKKTKKRLFEEQSNMEMEIGGMGLVNTYARLLLLYKDSRTFELSNTQEGADVIIGGAMEGKGRANDGTDGGT